MVRSRLIVVAMLFALAISLVKVVTVSADFGSDVQYIVHPGDTLYRIAVSHGVTVRQLVVANRIRNANQIFVGQVLHIPKDEPAIILEQPTSGAHVTSPVTVSGRANTFEGQVNIRVLDSRFRQVGTGTAIAAMGEYQPFTTTVFFSVSYSQWGYVDAYWVSPKDGSELDKVTVKVYLQKGVATPIPSPGPTAAPTPTPTPTATPGPAVSVTYHVHPSDTLYRIALSHKVSVRDIVRANRIRNPNLIFVGQPLLISSAHPGILLTSPADGEAVSSPITVTGRSDTFEGNVIVDVLDRRFRRVGTTTAQGGTLGSYAPFTTSVAYVISAPQWGYVEAYWPSPKDGSKLDAVTARVHLSLATAVSPMQVTPTPEAVRYHVVRRGETLFSIAARYGVTIRQIVAANGLRNPNRIYVGQRLIIP